MKKVSKEKSKAIRVFSEEFKKRKAIELTAKQVTVTELSRLYSVSRSAVYKWLYKYSPGHEKKVKLVVEMESESHKTMRLQQQVAELERIIGQKQLEIDYLNKLLEIGSDEMGFDIKKNFSARPSNGSGSTRKPSE
jgi:transposase